jgi:predicted nucleic acid-binding protein
MYTLDANIFTRTLHPSQPDYEVCDELITRLSAGGAPIIIPLIVLAEVAAAVRRETGDAMQARLFVDVIRGLPTTQFISIDAVLADESANLASDEALRGMDAIYVAVARRYNCTLVSLDGRRAPVPRV